MHKDIKKISFGCNLQSGPYGGGNHTNRKLVEHFTEKGAKISFDLNDPELDLIIMIDPRRVNKRKSNFRGAFGDKDILKYLLFKNPNTMVVQVVHDCDERKGTKGLNRRLAWSNPIANKVIFISNWQLNLFKSGGFSFNNPVVVHQASDEELFQWDGKPRWDGKGQIKLVTHHWSGNWMKGFDIYQLIDKLLEDDKWKQLIKFTHIGNLPKNFKYNNARHLTPLSGLSLAKELSTHHAYVTGSINEPAGIHHVEGALSGLPIIFRKSGAIPEYCNGFGESFEGTNDFIDALNKLLKNYFQWADKLKNYDNNASKMCSNFEVEFDDMFTKKNDLIQYRKKILSKNFIIRTLLGLTPKFTT